MNTPEEKKELVLIGNGMAGVAVLEEILALDKDRYNITVFGKEPHPGYNRILLADILTDEKTLADITLNQADWYAQNNITLRTSCPVKEINRARRTVITDSLSDDPDGEQVKYDKLILATGSLPFMPPIEGIEKNGVTSFRNVGDCEKIKHAMQAGAKKAVVIGAGLVGLEAAHALTELDMEVTVVHLMDKLMERQLDLVAARYLKDDLEKMGIKVLTGKETVKITGDERVTGLLFKDGDTIETDLVVISIGIKPNAALARSAGIYTERGIVVSDTMQTYDPSIYAVGECVQHRKATFGLVAQILDQARVAANHLAGDCRMIFRQSPASTKLKIPGIELYSAGAVTDDHEDTISYSDKCNRLYKKIFLKDGKIEGLVMYGDTSDGPTLFQRLLDNNTIESGARAALLGQGLAGHSGTAIEDMSDDAIVCGCNGITKGMIVDAVVKKGLFTRQEVANETKASDSCGGCSSLVEQILENVLGTDFQGMRGEESLCPCTRYTRDDVLKNIREKHLLSVSEVMDTLGWESVGCDKCRPALNYYVSLVWPEESTDDPTSRLVNERVHANIQQDGTFSVIPRMYGGVTTPSELRRIAEVADKYNVPLVKVTGGQRLDLLGVSREDLPRMWKELDMPSGFAYAKALRTVKTCVGKTFCRYGTQDSMGLGVEMEKLYEGLWTPAKVKIGVSGCPRNCAEYTIKDVGILGVMGGWEVYVGGAAGIELRRAELLATVTNETDVTEIVSAFLQHYREDAVYGERTAKWVARTGIETIKKTVINDPEIRKELVENMNKALGAIKEPWKEIVNKRAQSRA